MNSSRKSAFTLIELLVSLAISGVLILILNNLINNSIFTDAKIQNQLEYRLKIESLLAHIDADILSASYKLDGNKSIRIQFSDDRLELRLKRFGTSPRTQQIIGFEAIWTFDSAGVSRSVNSPEGTHTRLLSDTFISAKVENLTHNIIKLTLVDKTFTKSKMFKL
tara:strand:- start:2706 stop:3200 length:495 start_codon:yes stop_codon:yes gene_type:complete